MSMWWLGLRLDEAAARTWIADPPEDVEEDIDLDKAWHAIHWLLTGSDDVTDDITSQVILGGTEIGEDWADGPASLADPATVAAVAKVLADLPPQALAARMDPAAMTAAGLYPGDWEDDDLFEEYLAPYYEELRAFYAAAAAAGQAVIHVLT